MQAGPWTEAAKTTRLPVAGGGRAHHELGRSLAGHEDPLDLEQDTSLSLQRGQPLRLGEADPAILHPPKLGREALPAGQSLEEL